MLNQIKYLKYKLKYLSLKNQLGGTNEIKFKDTHSNPLFSCNFSNKKVRIEEVVECVKDYIIKEKLLEKNIRVSISYIGNTIFTIDKDKINIINSSDRDVGSEFFLSVIPKYSLEELASNIFERSDVKRLDRLKPVATIESGVILKHINENVKLYTAAEKEEVRQILSKIASKDVKIHYGKNQIVFYLDILEELCKIFEYTLEQGLEIIGTIQDTSNVKIMYFIKCAFNNDYDGIDEYIASNKLDPTLCKRFKEI
jgi:hypothetical protein